MNRINFSTYDFPLLKNGTIIRRYLRNSVQLLDYLLNLIKCDLDSNAQMNDNNSILFCIGGESFVLQIESL